MSIKFGTESLTAQMREAYVNFKNTREIPSEESFLDLVTHQGDLDPSDLWQVANSIQRFSSLDSRETPGRSELKWFHELVDNLLVKQPVQEKTFQAWYVLRAYLLFVDGYFNYPDPSLYDTQEIDRGELRKKEESYKRDFWNRYKDSRPELFETDELGPNQLHKKRMLEAANEQVRFRRNFSTCVDGLEYIEYQSQKRFFRLNGEIVVFPNQDRVVDLLFQFLANYEEHGYHKDKTGLRVLDIAYELSCSEATVIRNITYLKNSLKVLHELGIYFFIRKNTRENRYWLEIADQTTEYKLDE